MVARTAFGGDCSPTADAVARAVSGSPTWTLEPAEREVSRRTLAYYNASAEAFWAATRDHDVTQNIAALLSRIEGEPPFQILDLGCGPGRDLASFVKLGHRAVGLEGAATLASMARANSGCEVWEQDFLAPQLPLARFDGVFSNASLFHVPSRRLPDVLRALHATLKPRGVLMSSNPRGNDFEGWSEGRYGVWHSLEGWRRHLLASGFVELEHYYRPAGLPRDRQPWLASVWRKVEANAPPPTTA
jgi:SAM-dependent methyltransferase